MKCFVPDTMLWYFADCINLHSLNNQTTPKLFLLNYIPWFLYSALSLHVNTLVVTFESIKVNQVFLQPSLIRIEFPLQSRWC